MLLLDSSILVAAYHTRHPDHAKSFGLVDPLTQGEACCSAHALAETFAVLTGLPYRPRTSSADAVAIIDNLRSKLTVVELTVLDYEAAFRQLATRGLTGGAIYDALHLQCARNVGASGICTWNVKDFQRIAPDLKAIIRTP
jgi:predicted nucleic acid-binding protein